jgi:transcriptional regulator with XRE-family HTH domain
MFFAHRFKTLRDKSGYDQKEIAKIINVTPVAVNKYELGKGTPSLENLIKLRKLFNASIDYMLGLDLEDAKDLISSNSSKLICESIKTLRLKRGDTQKEFAFKVDMDVKEIEEIEGGKIPHLDQLIKISSMLEVSLDELIGDTKIKIVDKEQDSIINFALNLDNRGYIKLAMAIKEQGLCPDDVVFGKRL